MKTVYLLYISLGVALATIFYLYKSHKETMKKIETIQNLVSSIQQVPVMKYNDTEIQTTIKSRCDEIEELIHFVNDEISTKLDKSLNKVNEITKSNTPKPNIPKAFFTDFIEQNNDDDQQGYDYDQYHPNDHANDHANDHDNETNQNKQNSDRRSDVKNYEKKPILDIEGFKDNEYATLSLSSLDKAPLDVDSVHNSSLRNEKNILGELILDNNANILDDNEDLIETYDLNNKIQMDFEIKTDFEIDLTPKLDNVSRKSASHDNKHLDVSANQSNTSNNYSVSDNSKIPKLNELKQIAKSMDLSTNGNKKEIFQRLLDNGYIF